MRPIYIIAREITKDWSKINYGAKPYLDAMFTLNSMSDNYGYDSANSIIIYFLANAQTWRGETAKKIKSELKYMTSN
jgi:hypothetical protein